MAFPTNQRCIEVLEQLERECKVSGARHLGFTYSKAIKALKSCSVEIKSGKDAIVLPGIGKYIASKLDEALHNFQPPAAPVSPSLSSSQHLPPPAASNGRCSSQREDPNWSSADSDSNSDLPFTVGEWLSSLGLEVYEQKFIETGFDNMRVIQELTAEDLEAIGIPLPGHKKTLLLASQRLKKRFLSYKRRRRKSSNKHVSNEPNSQHLIPLQSIKTAAPVISNLSTEEETRAKVTRLVIMRGTVPVVTETFVVHNSSDESFAKGKELFEKGAIVSLVLNGEELLAEIKKGAHYHRQALRRTVLSVATSPNSSARVTKATCSCSYRTKKKQGWCKHIVATLFSILNQTSRVTEENREVQKNSSSNHRKLNKSHSVRQDMTETEDTGSRKLSPKSKQRESKSKEKRHNSSDGDDSGRQKKPKGSKAPCSLDSDEERRSESAKQQKLKRTHKSNELDEESNVIVEEINHEKIGSSNSVRQGKKEYLPRYRSGAWALLMVLYRESSSFTSTSVASPFQRCLTKEKLIQLATPLSDASFEEEQGPYTAWSAMTTLIKKALVEKTARPARYSLTVKGSLLAERLFELDKQLQASPDTSTMSENEEEHTEEGHKEYKKVERNRDIQNGVKRKRPSEQAEEEAEKEEEKEAPKCASPQEDIDELFSLGHLSPPRTPTFFPLRNLSQETPTPSRGSLSPLIVDISADFSDTSPQREEHVEKGGASCVFKSIENSVDHNRTVKEKRTPFEKEDVIIVVNTDSEVSEQEEYQKSSPNKRKRISTLETNEREYSSPYLDDLLFDIRDPFPSVSPPRLSFGSSSSLLHKADRRHSQNEEASMKEEYSEFLNSTTEKNRSSNSDKAKEKEQYFTADDGNEMDWPDWQEDKEGKRDSNNRPITKRKEKLKMRNVDEDHSAHYKQKQQTYEVDEVVLLLDNREIHANSVKTLAKRLKEKGIACETRNLALGDMLWVARCSVPSLGSLDPRNSTNSKYDDKFNSSESDDSTEKEYQETKDFVLDFIVERKRIDDLLASISDGRYEEQKFRLKRCGLATVIYLIEGRPAPPDEEILEQAIVNTNILDGFLVIQTENERDTTNYLASISQYLRHHFTSITIGANTAPTAHKRANSPRELLSGQQKMEQASSGHMTIQEFCQKVSKSSNLTLSDVFGKQLMQITGCTPEKAFTITRHYPTPHSLVYAFDQLHDERKQNSMLARLEICCSANSPPPAPTLRSITGRDDEEDEEKDRGRSRHNKNKDKNKKSYKRDKKQKREEQEKKKARTVGMSVSKRIYHCYNDFKYTI